MIESDQLSAPFLPPYSLDFNPIEQFWARFKWKIREVIGSFLSLEYATHYLFNSRNR